MEDIKNNDVSKLNKNFPFLLGNFIAMLYKVVPTLELVDETLTLKMTTEQVVETSVTGNNNSPIQDYVHPDDQTQHTFEMTPGFKPFTEILLCYHSNES